MPHQNTAPNQNTAAEELLREGKLDEAMAALKSAVQGDPSNGKLRVFLFQMLSVFGKWESALKQLVVAGDLDPGNLAMVQAYREAIRCEEDRRLVFQGEQSPTILGEPDQWLALMIESFKQTASGNFSQAAQLRDEAFESAPATSGTLQLADESTSPFEWIADADPRMGPVLEAMLNGQYYWIPMHRIARIDLEAPSDLRDFVWAPAHLTLATGTQCVAMIPTRYFGSESQADAGIRLARTTDWQSIGNDDLQLGLGQRMLATDQDDFAMLDVRQVRLDVESPIAEDGESEVKDDASFVPPASIDLTTRVPSSEGA